MGTGKSVQQALVQRNLLNLMDSFEERWFECTTSLNLGKRGKGTASFWLDKRVDVTPPHLRQMKPLDAHPEFSVSIPAPGAVEFKVENWRLRKGGPRVPRDGPGLGDVIFVVCSTWVWYKFGSPKSMTSLCPWLCVVSLYLYFKCTRLLHESVLILPHHGIQLETHRGLNIPLVRPLPLTARRHFIPLTSIRDVIINEGLRRWDVRYYICVIRDTGSEVILDVAFENILPRLPVLEFVYNEIQDLLQNPKNFAPKKPGPSDNITSAA